MSMRLALSLLLSLIFGFVPALAQVQGTQISFSEKQDMDPQLSPDGKQLVFSSNRTGSFNLFLITLGESGVVQLTQTKKGDRHPAWLPGGKRLIFSSKRTGNFNLYEMAADGTAGFLQLSDMPSHESCPGVNPKSEALVFSISPNKAFQLRPKSNIALATGRDRINSPQMLGEGDQARFSPDGASIAFTSRRTKNKDVWLMKADGAMPTQLTTDPKDDEYPSFSPDGKHLIFASKRTGNYDLWMMGVDGSNPRQLTSDPADEIQPCWGADAQIYYVKIQSSSQSSIFRIPAP